MTMEMFQGILIGIIIWQFIVVILCQFSLSEDTLLGIAICFWLLPLKCTQRLYRKISLLLARRYNCYQFYGDVSKSKMESKADMWIANYYLTTRDAAEFKQVSAGAAPESYTIRLLREGKSFKSPPHKSEIFNFKKMSEGFDGYTPNFFSLFLRDDSKWKKTN